LKKQLQDIIDGKSNTYEIKRPTIFHDYVDAKLSPSVKTAQGFTDDADIFISAGYETSGHTIATTTFYILGNPDVYKKLTSDLCTHWSDPAVIPSWKELENIPYLHATIKEALRMSMGVAMRLLRVNHTSPVRYREWEIPPHTIIGMTQRDIPYDPSIFPDPHIYKPERWLWLDAKSSNHLDKFLISFSRGARECLGKQ
jgi:cytochrome P450